MAEFKLSAELVGHESDVREVRFPSPNVVLSASRDNTVRVWRKNTDTPDSPPEFVPHTIAKATEYVNSISYIPPFGEYPEGLVLSGGKECIIDVRKPDAEPSQDAERLLVGHGNNVCTIDVSPSLKWLVSGGWDGQARIWAVSKWQTDILLDGHDGASVWAVLAFNESTVVTGCADGKIRVFDMKRARAGQAEPIATISTPQVVRALCKLPEGHPSGAVLASAGNDGIIRLWKLNGETVAELHGHDSFIYSLDVLRPDCLVSSGEDRTVRVWKGTQCIQTITLPAISVWSVAVCPDSGDIVTGSSDGAVRIFTRDPARAADATTLKQFEESVQASAIPAQTMGEINKEKLPGPTFLTEKSGTKEGQVQLIKEDDGRVTAHTWSVHLQKWESVGSVVDSAASSGQRVEYQGQSYDFVFDVAIEEGQPSLKLPYNLSENPYERATKFINDNELSLNYLDQVANFITQNTQAATLGQSEQPSGPDPLGTEHRYIPGQSDTSSSSVKLLPFKKYLTILAAKHELMYKKIKTLNSGYKESGRKDISLPPSDEAKLGALMQSLESGEPIDDKYAVSLVIRSLRCWPYSERIAMLDLFRCLAASPAVASYIDELEGTIIDVALTRAIDDAALDPPNMNLVMLALRVAVNIFNTPEGRMVAAEATETVVASLEKVVPDMKGNKQLMIAVGTLCINYAVLRNQEGEKDSGVSDELAMRLGQVMKNVVVQGVGAQDGEVVFRGLAGLGTLMKGVKEGVEGVRSVVVEAMGKIGEARVKNVGGEILGMLK